MKRWFTSAIAMLAIALVAVPMASAEITPPTVDVEPLAQGILDSLDANLTTILTAAGILAGVFFVLRMARRWFGARSSA